jgi:hypothetical protein
MPNTNRKMSEKISHKFDNGLEVTGTLEEIITIAKTLSLNFDVSKFLAVNGGSLTGYYNSTSKGVIRIDSMSDMHLRRALLKRARIYYTEIFDMKDTNKEFQKKFVSLANDRLVYELYNELSKRK